MVYVLGMTYTSDIETKLLIIVINFGNIEFSGCIQFCF